MMPHDRSGCPADRHGTWSAYSKYGCRCADAREASRLYRKRLHYGVLPPSKIDATGTKRRICALQALGWPASDLAARLGRAPHRSSFSTMLTRDRCTTTFAARVAALYDELSMTPGPSRSTRLRAESKGWVPPLAWEAANIDDPAAEPDVTSDDDADDGALDPVAVHRAMSGRLPASNLTTAERRQAVAQLLNAGVLVTHIANRLSATQSTIRKDRDVVMGQGSA